ncbi:GRIP and coiled-coil domain-containing protein 2-like isoform X2 [Phlebotomus papatasi]|uniref:GRIP and coiled-coil domain-containing protein 2-like isoform X2 n=1 Tax=Phlebotomus papatasi TaxID=29031 RepID=UPI0024839869|nr:GRIP and coiled-coil domain-containing protein 2-like isoform X2 [Phlebotomus papatasi]
MAEIKQKISSNKFNESASVDISGSAVAANERLKCSDEQCKKVSEECQVHKVLVDKKPPVPIKRKKNVPVTEKSSVEVDAESLSARNTVTMNKRLKVDDKVVTSKPPLPPKPDKLTSAKIAPKTDKVKRKAEENRATLVAKLNAYAEQLRLEVADLKASLITERSAVRALRAQIEANTRRAKVETKKHQEALLKKVSVPQASTSSKKINGQKKDEPVGTASIGIECSLLLDTGKLNQEISILRDTNKCLEEKVQITSEAEKRKSADMRELKDSYELRLTQITKSAKTEIHRLLEEIKSKDRMVRQLKKELMRKDVKRLESNVKNSKNHQDMRKLKEPERSSGSSTNSSKMTTCGGNEFVSMPHEMPTRILEAHNELHMYRNKDPAGSDNDSALSSAPPSLSPQPNSPPDVWQTYNTKEVVCHGSLQKEINFLQRENDALNVQLCAAREKIRELEKALLVTQNGDRTQHLIEKIRLLEQKESELSKEAYELKEQNELLEFRIVELEESHDKWSLRSNSTPDTRDVWTDTEKEHDDLLMMSERSDSGVTSPHSHHQLDDRTSLPSPCDLSMIDSIPNDDVRKRIIAMTKRPCYDDDDKLCLLQILSLLNNLEALSQDQEITGEFLSLEINQSRRSGSTENYSVLAEETPNRLKNQARIVATVQPYSSGLDCEEPIKPRYTALPNTQETCLKRKHLSTSNLQESGVFDTDSADCTNQATQTCPEDFPVFEPRSGDLTAEIQKLNKFRERIEEVVTAKKSSVVNLLSPEQSRLQYYKDRLELLENKILVYESSGDLQVRRLAERLQREIHLESLVKQLSGKLEELEKENRTLDEERCEFEEAENDTRLRLQRLEVEFEILNQRNIELEMSREALQSKLKDTKRQVVSMEDQIEEYQMKIEEVENSKNDLSCTMEKIKNAMPVLMLYHEFQLRQGLSSGEILTPKITNDGISMSSGSSENSTEKELRQKVSELTNRVKELEKGIDELKLAYNETLENADNLWAQMEKDYKDRLQQMELTEQNMKVKIGQLEERIIKDSQYAQERIGQMEDSEYTLKSQICKLNRENKELLKKYTSLVDEYNTLKEDCQNLKSYLEGPAAAVLEKERSKVKILEDDLNHSQEILKSLEAMHKNDSSSLKAQVTKANKELEHVKVTNHELYEEVSTLETRLREMRKVKAADDETIKSLSQELRAKQIQLNNLQQMIKHGSPPTLAQELGTSKRICLGDPKPLKKATFELQNSIKNFEGCKNCMSANPQVVDMCKGVKRLADSLLDDAERGKSPSKTEEFYGRFVTTV